MKINIVTGAILFVLLGPAWAERAEESVLLIDMTYSQGRWQAKPITVLPCDGPSKPDSISRTRSMFQLKSREGKVLFRRFIENPRIILVEDPKESVSLLKETRFTLRIPIRQEGKRAINLKDIHTFDFFESGREQEKPSVSARLDTSMPLLSKPQATAKRLSCQIAAPTADKLPDLKVKPGDAISPESLASMIQRDSGLLIRWGLENGVTPDGLRKIVLQHEKRLAQINLSKSAANSLLKEYEAAYKKSAVRGK